MTAKKVLLAPINSTLISLGVGAGREGEGYVDARWTMMNPVTRRINQCQSRLFTNTPPSQTLCCTLVVGGRKKISHIHDCD